MTCSRCMGAAMKYTTIIGTLIAVVALTACGATARPAVSPTLALSVAPTVTPTPTALPTVTPMPTPAPSDTPSSSPSPSPNPTEGPCGYAPCGTGASVATTCDPVGTAGGGSIVVTWT